MLSVASVMMKGCGRRPNTYTAPLTKPTARPLASMAAMMMAEESVTLNSSPPITVARAKFAPTERSMPRVRMTRCWPSATIAITDVCARMLLIFAGLRNTGVVMLTTSDQDHEDQDRTRAQEAQGERNREAPRPALAALACNAIAGRSSTHFPRIVFIIDKDRQLRRSQSVFYGLKTALGPSRSANENGHGVQKSVQRCFGSCFQTQALRAASV